MKKMSRDTRDSRWRKPLDGGLQDSSLRQKPEGGMRKAFSMSQLANTAGGMMRTESGNMLSSFHSQDKWEEQGGWKAKEASAKQMHSIERDASMVNLLNLVDPESLVDKAPQPGEIIEEEQHSALTRRGVVYVGGLSAMAWYCVRLVLRDVIRLPNELIELHTLSTIHSLGWAAFLAHKAIEPGTQYWLGTWPALSSNLPKYCSRALVASLGYYLHDCWTLRGTMLSNPSMLVHQASMVVTVSSILRSKGVAWLAVPIMSQAVPNLLQQLLRLCGTIGLPAVRPEVRGLRLLWFISFVTSKLGIIPTWLKYRNVPEVHQPNLLYGKLTYLVCFALDLLFMRSAVRDLPQFLRPGGVMVPAAQAYKKPLQGAQAAGTAVVAAMVLGTVFGSYASAPVAIALAVAAVRRGSSQRMRVAAGLLCSVCALDQVLPQPQEFPKTTRYFRPLFRQALKIFNFRIYPKRVTDGSDPFGLQYLKDLPKDRHHLIATTPHGLFPWGAGTVIVSCIEAGYLPNFVGASVLGALPLAGRLLRNLGFIPATRKNISECLKKEYPRNVTIILPGGIREMFQIREDIEISASNLHSGFADIAKEGGAMLIPSYAFGVSQLYKVATGPLAEFFASLSRKLKVSVALFSGRWGTLLPYPYEMAAAMGEPVDTLKCADGKEAHGLYLKSLRAAFEEHKGEFGWPERELFFEGEDMPKPPADTLDEYTALPTSRSSPSHSKL